MTTYDAIAAFCRGNLEPAQKLFEVNGLSTFREIKEKYWKLSRPMKIYRAMTREEFASTPKAYAGYGSQIQRLTSWTWDIEFATNWQIRNNRIVAVFDCLQEDIVFAPLNLSPHPEEKEVVIADYHLQRDRLSIVEFQKVETHEEK